MFVVLGFEAPGPSAASVSKRGVEHAPGTPVSPPAAQRCLHLAVVYGRDYVQQVSSIWGEVFWSLLPPPFFALPTLAFQFSPFVPWGSNTPFPADTVQKTTQGDPRSPPQTEALRYMSSALGNRIDLHLRLL